MKDELGNEKYVCDSCGGDAYGQLQLHFWYGSLMDLSQGAVYICDDCAVNVIKSLKTNFGITIKLKDITEI
jgi:hypothetical protein